MRRCRYRVTYDFDVARFTSLEDAMAFARQQRWAEVSDRTGLIGQFEDGRATPEFDHLNPPQPDCVRSLA